jgi:hypothetical protein
MDAKRIFRHLLAPSWTVTRAFPRAALDAIEAAIRASETRHNGELRFAVEAGRDLGPLLRGETPRQRAEQVFTNLRVWDTAANSGVLIYVQLVDHRIEIVADRGISARVAQSTWDAVCRRMESAFRARRYKEGVLAAVDEITALLAAHFPATSANANELPDSPVIL